MQTEILKNEPNNISEEEYKNILLKLMDSIDDFCRNNNIKYFMLGGTMLGAVRHRGFIPWDDDIDIGMFREDYERFCNTFNDKKNSNFKLISVTNNKQYYLPSAKVYDSNTVLIENLNQSIPIGVYIDIFPLDYIKPNNKGEFDFFVKRKFLNKVENLKKMKILPRRPLIKNFLIFIGHCICWKSVHSIALHQDNRAIKLSCPTRTDWIANYHGAWKEREIMNSSIFDEISEYEFSGKKLYGVKDYDSYLSQLYGDYMQLPPLEKRVSHHEYSVRWKNNTDSF